MRHSANREIRKRKGLYASPNIPSTFRNGINMLVKPGSVASVASPGKGHETILLVEDEDSLRKLFKVILTQHGYTVLEAPGGEEALVICAQYPGEIQLLLTDMVMPKMGGRQLAEKVRGSR